MKLTDDEVVILSLRGDGPWPAPTPTVDIDDREALAGAARRGERSLYVRGMLPEGEDAPWSGLDPELTTLLDPALQRRLVCSVFMTDDAGRWLPQGLTLVVYRGDGTSYLVETVSPGGVHEFGTASAEVAFGSVDELVAAAWEGGVRTAETAPPTATLCVAAPRETEVEVLEVRRGAVSVRTAETTRPLSRERAAQWVSSLR